MDLKDYLHRAVEDIARWQDSFGHFDIHPSLVPDDKRVHDAWTAYTERLQDNYPFFHPRYAGQMLKPPHPVAIAGYVAAMLINPNNHALDGGPATGQMEKEVVQDFADMFGFPEATLGHLTSNGTVANLEALWVARHEHPGKKIAYSEEAHYTHSRMCEVLGIESVSIRADAHGKMDCEALEEQLQTENIGTVVATLGTTGLGALDPVHDIVELKKKYGFRIHVDGAYGGFFMLLALGPDPLIDSRPFLAIRQCDSIVMDPHKHGLQPYGCGSVLFSDARVGKYYRHDSPYTYFTSNELHLGEISLECSRAGASAGALWFTLKCFPLRAEEGLGPVLKQGILAARAWYDKLLDSEWLQPYQLPELDILGYFPRKKTTALVDQTSQELFERSMRHSSPVFTSVYRVSRDAFERHAPEVLADTDTVRILRSVLMKPEHIDYVDTLHRELSDLAQEIEASQNG